ncbi:eCIS core domain-containing protein [Phormidesmis priestleyi]
MGDQRSHHTTLESHRQQSKSPVSKPPIGPHTPAHPLLQLQRQIGNRAVTHLIQTNLIQAKLSVSQPNDAYEQEADRVANTVMRMPDPIVQRQPSEEEAIQAAPIGRITPLMQRQEDEKEEPVQMLQRQVEEEKEPVQMLQRQVEEEQPIQTKATRSAPEVTSDLESRIQSMRGSGQPLPASTRAFFEPRFGYDFSGVRIHSNSQAGEVAQQLNAQAFTLRQDVFFGAGYYQPDTFQGRSLLAHELTHTVQQQPQPLSPAQTAQRRIQAAPSTPSLAHIQRHPLSISSAGVQIQRSLLDDALDWIADKAAYIPGYTLLTVVIGRNPINNRRVDPTPTNLVQGVLELIPVVGRLLFTALQSSGALDRVFNWVRQEIGQLNLTWDAIVAAFRRVDLSWDDAFSPSAAYRRFEREFSPIIDRVVRFARSVKDRVVAFIKEAILRPVGNFAKGLPIYPLLTVILGKDPITDEIVERNATSVIRGILLILPGGEEKFQNLQRSGIIDRAFNWFNQELTRLNLTWEFIKSLFARVWESLSVNDILSPIAAFNRIVGLFAEPIRRVLSFAGAAIRKVAEFIFEGVLTLAGGLGQRVLGIFNRARSVISTIIENPIGFVGNLVNAVKRGFQQFSNNVLTHLRAGLVGWLFGALAGAGLQLPQRFDLRGIVSLVVQILGLTYDRLRGTLVRLIGEENVNRVERVFGFLMTIVTQGLSAAWERIVEFAGNLQEMVMGGIRDWVARTIVGQAITRLVTLFNPAGAVIQAIMAIYNTVVFFIERAQQIGALVEAVFSSIATIASGNIAAAATYVEQTMARTIPVVISFLARLIGLGGISDQIRNVVRRIQAPIERAIERIADWIVGQVRNLLGRGSGTTGQPEGAPEGATGDFIHERAIAGGHTIKIRRDLKVFQFSDPTELSGSAAQEEQQKALEIAVPRVAPAYPTDSLRRARGPAGHVADVKDGEEREILPSVLTLPGGVAAYQPGDHRGHLIGDRFNGSANDGNLVPMHPTLNLSTFKSYENTLATAYKTHKNAGKGVLLFMQITPHYPSDDAREPASYRPSNIAAASKIITLQPGATSLAPHEQPYNDTFTNPGAVLTSVNVNNPDPGSLRAAFNRLVADAIIAERAKNGRFADVDDLRLRLLYRLGEVQSSVIMDQLLTSREHIITFR